MKVFNTSLLIFLVALLLPINPGDSCPPSGTSTSDHRPNPQPHSCPASGTSTSYHRPNPQPQIPHIVSRHQWGARSPRDSDVMYLPVDHVTVHHSDTLDCYDEHACCNIVYNIQTDHMYYKEPRYWDIAYSFLIGGDGSIYEGRGWNLQGAHAGNTEYNSNGFGICMIGNFQHSNPTSEALQALEQLIEYAVSSNMLSTNYNVVGHRDVRDGDTDCPGSCFYEEKVRHMKNYCV